MKDIFNAVALLFMALVCCFTLVAILGIWQMIGADIVLKSMATIGVLGLVSIIVIYASNFIDSGSKEHMVQEGHVASPAGDVAVFVAIRNMTLVVMVTSAIFLAFLGVMAIWELVVGDVLYRSLSTLGVLLFASLINVGVCMEREKNPRLGIINSKGHLSGGFLFIVIAFAWIVLSFVLNLA